MASAAGVCFTLRETASNEFLVAARGTEYTLKPQHLVDLLTQLAEKTKQLQVPVRTRPGARQVASISGTSRTYTF